MRKLKNVFRIINLAASWLDRLIFSRFAENYVPAGNPVLIPFCCGVFWGVVLIIFMFMDNANVFNDLFFNAAIVASTALNVMFHIVQIESLPSVKTKLGYFVFISVLSFFITAVIMTLIGIAAVFMLVLLVLFVIGATALSPSPPPQPAVEYGVELSNGDFVTHSYGDIWKNSSGESYRDLGDNNFIKL